MKNIDEIKEILNLSKEKIRNQFKAEIIGVFGSYVRGKQKRGSDLDILVKFYEGATLFEFIDLANFLEKKLGIKKVDIVPYDTIREEIKEKILKETVYL